MKLFPRKEAFQIVLNEWFSIEWFNIISIIMPLPQKYLKEICKGSNRFLRKTLIKPTWYNPLQRIGKHQHHMILMTYVEITHSWKENHNMKSSWVIIIMPSEDWKGTTCLFTINTIWEAKDFKEINRRMCTANLRCSFPPFNIHIENQWSWEHRVLEE